MSEKYSILLIEDDTPTAKEFIDYFKTLPDFEIVDVVDSGKKALEIIKRNTPSVLIVDIALTESSGIILLGALQNEKELPFRPYIIVTTIIQAQATRRAVSAMADYFFGKENPEFDPEVVAEHLYANRNKLPLKPVGMPIL